MIFDTIYVTRPTATGTTYSYGIPGFARYWLVRSLVLLALALPVWIVAITVLLVRAVIG